MDTKYIIGFVVAVALIVVGIAVVSTQSQTASGPAVTYDLNAFAQCLKDKGTTFYGAFWCPHCAATKKIFADAKSKLPYVECSTADGKGQLPICIEKKIESYPTWEFADGSRLNGELSPETVAPDHMVSLNDLAQKSSCPLIPRATSATQ